MSKLKRSGRQNTTQSNGGGAPSTPVNGRRKIQPLASRLVAGFVLLIAIAIAWWSLRGPNALPPAPTSEITRAELATYVDNKSCLGCHSAQAAQWRQSHHAQAMASPTAETVRADFNNIEFKHKGITSHFFKHEDRYFVRTDGPDGALGDFEIKYTFGVDPLQQYLIEMPGGRLQPLQIAWDIPGKKWFHLLPNEKTPAGDVLHWTGRYQTANTMCIACHTTGYEKRYDANSDTFASTWKEPNVSCQSCHGPGKHHVQWATMQAKGVVTPSVANERLGLIVDFKSGDSHKVTDVCAQCHSRRSELTATPVPGEPRFGNYLPSLLHEGLYHADGQQLDEVFVDGSFRQSKMYQKGVNCSNCHNPHSGKLKLNGNAVCTQCHQPKTTEKFVGAAGMFDTPAHHFHQAGSAGAQCAACHMPDKNYMRIQRRLDHSLRIPRPDLTVKIGVPNACTNCHADKPAQWAADQVANWYPSSRLRKPHYGEAFTAVRNGQPGAYDALSRLVADPQYAGIVRATALTEMRPDPATGANERIQATHDNDPEVRAAAAYSLASMPTAMRKPALTPLLSDPVRAVRIAAARNLASLPPDQLDAAMRPDFDAALSEYIAAQNVSLDMPGAHLNLAVLYQDMGQIDLAEQHYLKTLKIDPDFTAARANLAQLYNATSRNTDAEHVLVEGLKRMPELGELQYSLGLLLAEENRLPEAIKALTKAARLLPSRSQVHYNLGLALQQQGLRKLAESALLRAQKIDPLNPAPPYALALFYAQGGQQAQALVWAQQLQALTPSDPKVNQLIEKLSNKHQ